MPTDKEYEAAMKRSEAYKKHKAGKKKPVRKKTSQKKPSTLRGKIKKHMRDLNKY